MGGGVVKTEPPSASGGPWGGRAAPRGPPPILQTSGCGGGWSNKEPSFRVSRHITPILPWRATTPNVAVGGRNSMTAVGGNRLGRTSPHDREIAHSVFRSKHVLKKIASTICVSHPLKGCEGESGKKTHTQSRVISMILQHPKAGAVLDVNKGGPHLLQCVR